MAGLEERWPKPQQPCKPLESPFRDFLPVLIGFKCNRKPAQGPTGEWEEALAAARALGKPAADLEEQLGKSGSCLVMDYIPGPAFFKAHHPFLPDQLHQTASDLGRCADTALSGCVSPRKTEPEYRRPDMCGGRPGRWTGVLVLDDWIAGGFDPTVDRVVNDSMFYMAAKRSVGPVPRVQVNSRLEVDKLHLPSSSQIRSVSEG